jgi:ankyrin repeat protein
VAYEIDKENRRFLTIGIQQDSDDVTSLANLETDLNVNEGSEPSISFDSSTEMTTIPLRIHQGQDGSVDIKSIEIAMSDCILGEMSAVLRFPHTSKEPHILVCGKDEGGNTALSYVAAEKHLGMVSLLVKRGSNVNNRNAQGRTPLMEAALWGRAENVRILL